MRTSPTTAQLDAAMARVQSKLEHVKKNKGVEVDGPKAKWESRYATFEALHDACHGALKEEGIAIYQGGLWLQGAGERLVTRLSFQGEWIESDYPIKSNGDGAQKFGGGISFARRWGLCGMVGLVPYDAEERQGYRDDRPVRPQRAKAAQGLPERIASINGAGTTDELIRRAIEARSAHAVGEDAAAVEKAICAWLAHAFREIVTPDELTDIKDAVAKLKPRGTDVHAAAQIAERRILDGKS